MFLTKKELVKLIISTAIYSLLFALMLLCRRFAADLLNDTVLNALFVVIPILLVYIIAIGPYARGTAKYVNVAKLLVLVKIKPAEFLKMYDELRSSRLVVCKPKFDVLQFVCVAYDVTDNKEKLEETLGEMLRVTKGRKHTCSELLYASYLYSVGKFDSAEEIYSRLSSSKLDVISRNLCDIVAKTDRARAIGDVATLENYFRQILNNGSKRSANNLSRLIAHKNLGDILMARGEYN